MELLRFRERFNYLSSHASGEIGQSSRSIELPGITAFTQQDGYTELALGEHRPTCENGLRLIILRSELLAAMFLHTNYWTPG